MSCTGDKDALTHAKPRGDIVAYLRVDGAMKAAEFYARAFGAEIVDAYPPDDKGRTMHVHLYLKRSSLMLSDAYPERGYPLEKPQAFQLMLPVEHIDAAWARAVACGAEVVMPVAEMFWGDRFGILRDPFGVIWSMNGPKEKAA